MQKKLFWIKVSLRNLRKLRRRIEKISLLYTPNKMRQRKITWMKRIIKKLSSQSNKLIEQVDIQGAICILEQDKAPGSNGFTISFYRFFWHLIKYDLKRCSNMLTYPIKWGGIATPPSWLQYRKRPILPLSKYLGLFIYVMHLIMKKIIA